MGRNRLPDKIKRVQGTYRPSRGESTSRKSVPTGQLIEKIPIPKGMTEFQKTIFLELTNRLNEIEFLRPEDLLVLERYSFIAELNNKAKIELKNEGLTRKGSRESKVRSVYYSIYLETHKELLSIEKLFCITPQIRAKLNLQLPTEDLENYEESDFGFFDY